MIQSDKVIDDISFVLHALTSVKKNTRYNYETSGIRPACPMHSM